MMHKTITFPGGTMEVNGKFFPVGQIEMSYLGDGFASPDQYPSSTPSQEPTEPVVSKARWSHVLDIGEPVEVCVTGLTTGQSYFFTPSNSVLEIDATSRGATIIHEEMESDE